MYRSSDVYHKSLSHTANCGNLAATRNCNKLTFSLDEVPRQQTFKPFFLDHPITQPCHADDAYDYFPFFDNLIPSPGSMLHKPDVYRSMSARLIICEVSRGSFIRESHMASSALYSCRIILCLFYGLSTVG